MFFNRLSQPAPKVYRLDMVWAGFTTFFPIIKNLCLVLGCIGLAGAFIDFPPAIRAFIPANLFAAVNLLISAQIISVLGLMAKQFRMAFIFDGTRREIRYETSGKNLRPQFEKPLSFSDIHRFRLTCLTRKGKRSSWRFDVVTEDNQVYPVTRFNDEKKARKIIRELQLLAGVSLEEAAAEEKSLSAYQEMLQEQFAITLKDRFPKDEDED